MIGCKICDRPIHIKIRKLCRLHYERAKKDGTIPITRPRKEPFDRVMAKIEKAPNGCWNFTGLLSGGHGDAKYGVISHGYRNLYAHRIAYEDAKGTIPEGLQVCHSCDNTICCNPDHLFLGTIQENTQDSLEKGRRARGTKNSQNKLTELQALEIRASTESGVVLGVRYGVSRTQISNIKRGKQWQYL